MTTTDDTQNFSYEQPKTTQLTEVKGLASKLAVISAKIGAMEKDGVNEGYGAGYRFISYAAFSARIRELYAEEKILFVPEILDWEEMSSHTTKSGGEMKTIGLKMIMHLYNGDDPSDHLDISFYGAASDTSDKGVNKALTSAVKYFLMRMHHTSDTDYDPDSDSPEPKQERIHTSPARAGTPRVTRASQKNPDTPTGPTSLKELTDLGYTPREIGDAAAKLGYDTPSAATAEGGWPSVLQLLQQGNKDHAPILN